MPSGYAHDGSGMMGASKVSRGELLWRCRLVAGHGMQHLVKQAVPCKTLHDEANAGFGVVLGL